MYIRPFTLFSTLHPALLLFYALGAPVLAMLGMHPALLIAEFLCAVLVHSFYLGRQSTLDGLKISTVCIVLITVFNMLTNAVGVTVLFKLGSILVTLEGLFYGFTSGLMLGTVILWFRCFTALVSNEKFLYLLGRRFQTAALLLSMILKLFPETRYKIHCIRLAQNAEEDGQSHTLRSRMQRSMRQISCLLEWSMEDGIETADAMKARGYGSSRRSSYQKYSFTAFDGGMGGLMLAAYVVSLGLVLWQKDCFYYYPTIHWTVDHPLVLVCGMMFLVCFLLMPVWMELGRKGGVRQ